MVKVVVDPITIGKLHRINSETNRERDESFCRLVPLVQMVKTLLNLLPLVQMVKRVVDPITIGKLHLINSETN